MNQKVLVMNGDGYGPTVIRAAESVLRAAAPDLDIYHAKIGADAYDITSYALPPDTVELVAQCDSILCGPVLMEGISERNPLSTIKKQMGLYLEYGEFYPLCENMGNPNLNTIILSPTVESTLNVYETESLDGVASEYYTSIDNISKIFDKSILLSEMKRCRNVKMVSDNTLYPIRERLIRNEYHKHFAATEFTTNDLSTKEIMFTLARDPSGIDSIVCDIHSATCVWGQATGMVGGSGLMPRAFLGDEKGLFMPSDVYPNDVKKREINPTSAILSAAVMLLNMGYEKAYNRIRKAVCEMYSLGRTTPDVGGKLNTLKFTEGVKQLIISE